MLKHSPNRRGKLNRAQAPKKRRHPSRSTQNTARSFWTARSRSVQPSLDVPFHAPTQDQSALLRAYDPDPTVTKLSNGMKIVTHNRKSFPVSHIALSIDMGSRYETSNDGEKGISHFLERAMLRSTTNRTTGTLIRDMAKLGCDISTSSTRENFMISATTPTRINPVLGAIADMVKCPEFGIHETVVDKHNYLHDSHLRQHNERDVLMNELIHESAFGNVGLGQGMFATEHSLQGFTPAKLHQWHQRFFTPDRFVLAGVNVDQSQFVALTEEMFQHLPALDRNNGEALKPSTPAATFTRHTTHYTQKHHQGGGGLTQLALYWEGAPIHDTPKVVSSLLLRQILGKGSPSSDGGPGKGMYSRLSRLAQRNTWIPLMDTFTSSYTDAGLFGIYGLAGPEAVDYYLDTIRDEVMVLHETLSDQDVLLGRESLRRQIYTQTASDLNYCETLARHVQLFGRSRHRDFFIELDKLTTADMRAVSRDLFAGETKPGLVTFGEPSRFLPHKIEDEFNLVIHEDNGEESTADDASSENDGSSTDVENGKQTHGH